MAGRPPGRQDRQLSALELLQTAQSGFPASVVRVPELPPYPKTRSHCVPVRSPLPTNRGFAMSAIFSRLLRAPKSLFAFSHQFAARRSAVARDASWRKAKNRQRLFLEPLEDRRLLAADLSITKLASV